MHDSDDSLNPQREQENERLVLESIMMNEFRIPEQQPAKGQLVELRLLPFPSEESAENHIEVLMTAHLEPSYPILPPRVSLTAVRGLSEDDVKLLDAELAKRISELAGHTQLMELVEHAREFLRARNAPPNLTSLHEQLQPALDDPRDARSGHGGGGGGGGGARASRGRLRQEELARLEEVEAELDLSLIHI